MFTVDIVNAGGSADGGVKNIVFFLQDENWMDKIKDEIKTKISFIHTF